MKPLLQQIRNRRLALGLKQNDMPLRVGISRQQYQRLEAKGNPRLDTLELIAAGLNSEIMLIPKDRLHAVQAIIEADASTLANKLALQTGNLDNGEQDKKSLANDPWQDLLGDE